MARFVGYCKNNPLILVISNTVKDEAFRKIRSIAYEIFNRHRISYVIRKNIFNKIKRRLEQLIDSRDQSYIEINSEKDEAREFYKELIKDPSKRMLFEEMSRSKHRRDLIPSTTDIIRLGEAIYLSNNKYLMFITRDGDFLKVKDEIESKWNMRVFTPIDLTGYYI